jgi:hypothetical protein
LPVDSDVSFFIISVTDNNSTVSSSNTPGNVTAENERRKNSVVPTIQNTKLGKEEKKRKGKKICGSYLSLALHASLASYSKFRSSCLRPKCQVPKTKVPETKVPEIRTVTGNAVADNSTDMLLPPNTQSIVPNLDIAATEVELILERISGRDSVIPDIPVLSVRQTPIDKVSGKDRIFAIAFPTLYPTGRAEFNTPRLQKVDLYNYIQYLLYFIDQRFARHPCWRFFVFNLLIYWKACKSAQFYVSKVPNLKDLTCKELTEILLTDKGLLPQIV